MGFVPDNASTATVTPAKGRFVPDESPSIGGLVRNAGTDIANQVKGIGGLAEGLVTHPVDTAISFATKLPGAVVGEAKRIGVPEIAMGATRGLLDPLNLMETAKTGEMNVGAPQAAALKKFGGALYDKPVTTAMDVAPAIGALGKGAQGAEMAAEAGDIGAPAAENIAPAAPPPPVPPTTPPPAPDSVPMGSTFQETVANLGKQIPPEVKAPMQQVGDFVNQKYSQAATKPGWNTTVADYMKEHGQNMTLKELGAAPGQVRKIGIDRARALADYADENGLVGKTGTIGRERLIPQRKHDAGGVVGGFRKMAADRGAVMNPDELITQIRSQLDDKYLKPGLYSGEKGLYTKALMELKRGGGRADDVADKISELFQESKGLDRLKRPSGPVSDVARIARTINHGMISRALTPEEMAIYEKGLEDYGALTQIHEFVKRRGSTEAGGRLGPGSGISRAAVQKFLDSVGYRAQAKIMKNLSEKIRSNPEIVKSPANLFRNYADEAAEAIDEMTDIHP